MPIQFNADDDFAKVVDGTEQVTLRRRVSGQRVSIAAAWRFSHSVSEAAPSSGHVTSADVTWQFQLPPGAAEPVSGDAVLDSSDHCYTILSVHSLRGGTRLRCESRELRVCFALDGLVDLQRAVWNEDDSEIVAWRTVRPAIPARVQPLEVTLDHDASPTTAESRVRIMLGEEIEVDADSRLVGPRGELYQIERYESAERIDALPVVTAVEG